MEDESVVNELEQDGKKFKKGQRAVEWSNDEPTFLIGVLSMSSPFAYILHLSIPLYYRKPKEVVSNESCATDIPREGGGMNVQRS
jgi:hypothetical protein